MFKKLGISQYVSETFNLFHLHYKYTLYGDNCMITCYLFPENLQLIQAHKIRSSEVSCLFDGTCLIVSTLLKSFSEDFEILEKKTHSAELVIVNASHIFTASQHNGRMGQQHLAHTQNCLQKYQPHCWHICNKCKARNVKVQI